MIADPDGPDKGRIGIGIAVEWENDIPVLHIPICCSTRRLMKVEGGSGEEVGIEMGMVKKGWEWECDRATSGHMNSSRSTLE